MAISDPIGDLLTRIRNGQLRGLAKVKSPFSRQRVRVLDVLQAEGFIRGYAEVEFKGGRKELEIELKYHEGRPVIRELKRVSTPGRRVYASVRHLRPHRSGLAASSRRHGNGVVECHVSAKGRFHCQRASAPLSKDSTCA
jgi:small subunit ribosomal protein S8